MKAMFVYENLDFERGVDPKEAIGIGSDYAKILRNIQPCLDELGFKEWDKSTYHTSKGKVLNRWARDHKIPKKRKEHFQEFNIILRDNGEIETNANNSDQWSTETGIEQISEHWFNVRVWMRFFDDGVKGWWR